jgi:hypothetical protein
MSREADEIYSLFYPAQTDLREIKQDEIDDFQLHFELR